MVVRKFSLKLRSVVLEALLYKYYNCTAIVFCTLGAMCYFNYRHNIIFYKKKKSQIERKH